jgi:hypothetical protein
MNEKINNNELLQQRKNEQFVNTFNISDISIEILF